MLCKNPTEKKITIIDSIMGSGKTSWAIQHMNRSPNNKKFIYITPFLNEVERVLSSSVRKFAQPENKKGGTKLESLKELIYKREDIVSTHALFQRMDNELIELIEMQGYTLILDEVMNVIDQVNISKNDLQLLLTARTKTGDPAISIDNKGFVQWNDKEYKDGNFEHIRNLANSNNLMVYDGIAMYWMFPVSAFKGFEEVYVLTYMFNGQIQRYYYDLFNLDYNFQAVSFINDSYELVPYIPLQQENRVHLKNLIQIYYSQPTDRFDINKIGEKTSAFSKSQLTKLTGNKMQQKLLKDHGFNFYYNKMKVPSNEVMWTTFLAFEKNICPKNLKKQFVEVTARATNDYADKSTCIYFANRYMNPITKQFFNSKGVKVDEDLFALSELLQWVFRSRVRKGKPINIYIPSNRMRTLLEKYLNNQSVLNES
ncbi:DEAD/DEAH box helicase family protein [Rossellomorea marisflavi]|uniref:DEAD/DEAH box helicase family protein n=1 Tax=Rossellomorea marisflavi TaxID=189381 RepID=UPI00201DCC45|nr:DEAD/DEAH box helicase family protein [Rossellomorea marisflavi]